MSPRPRFEKLEKSKREVILNAAATEFARLGFESASLNKIIARAGISKGATYYYFDDKADLFATVFDHLMAIFEKEFDPETIGVDGDFWGDLEELAVKSFRVMRRIPWSRGMTRAFMDYAHKNPDSLVGRRTHDVWRQLSVRFIERGQKAGVVRTDLTIDLLVDLSLAVDMTLGLWAIDNINVEDDDEIVRWSKQHADVFKRILERRDS